MRQYKITSERRRRIQEAIDRNAYKRGVSAKFVLVSPKVGVKLFIRRGNRDRSAARQKLAAQHRLGPRVGRRFTCICQGVKHYGYFTEVADMSHQLNLNKPNYKIKHMLRMKLDKVGITHEDMHAGNFGKIRNEWVCIDFDDVSTYYNEGEWQ